MKDKMKAVFKQCWESIPSVFEGFISGMWVVRIVNQMIATAGNIAESAFLLATLWVLVNIAGYTLIAQIVDAHTILVLNNLCSIAFAALPELLFFGVIKTCIGHSLTAYKQGDKVALTWAILYSIPAISFGIITIYVLSIASRYGLQTAINLGEQWLIVRYLSGLFYAIIHSIDVHFAKPHFASKMVGKEREIKSLETRIEEITSSYKQQIATLTADNKQQIEKIKLHFAGIVDKYTLENDWLKGQLSEQENQILELSERASSLELGPIEKNFPAVKIEWIDQGIKSVTIDQIADITGLSKIKIRKAPLKKSSRGDGLYRVSSVIDWLKTLPVSTNHSTVNHNSNGYHEADTDALTLPVFTVIRED